ncbi:hypothetical protein BX616_008303 [Lobosporangium transversale]|nr:hypothetical protein BX616_008303 [Lobosporangium transversale]
MPFHLRVIASVEERRQMDANAVEPHIRELEANWPPRKRIIYIPRELCLQHRLRNTFVALTLPGSTSNNNKTVLYASVRIYSKESMLFRKDSRFPDKLLLTQPRAAELSLKEWPVVVSNLLYWEIRTQLMTEQLRVKGDFHDDISMPADQDPISVDANIINNLGNVLEITVNAIETNTYDQLGSMSTAIARSLSGFVASLNSCFEFKSPYGIQSFRIIDIKTTNSDHPDVGLISSTTVVKYVSPMEKLVRDLKVFSHSSSQGSDGLLSQEDWISAIKAHVGGYDDMLVEIVGYLYGFIQEAIHDTKRELNLTTTKSKSKPCFRQGVQGFHIPL